MAELIKKNKFIFLIFLFALLLRVWNLSDFPGGFHVDEVKVGWNAYSILKTGLDDRGNKLALYYNSFGDYRPTGIFYVTILPLFILGNTELAVRLPAAILGALTVFSLYLFVREIFSREKNKNILAYISSLILAISPWHISVSRATSEVVISMFLALTGLYFLVRFINTKVTKYAVFSSALLIVSYFFYHSVRLLVPLFLFGILFFFWKELTANTKKYAVGVFLLLSITTVIFSLNKEARGRFSQVSIFNDLDVAFELSKMPFEEGPNNIFIARLFHNKPIVYAKRFITEYTSYFSADFLIGKEGKPARYSTVGMGVLTYAELGLFILGLIYLAQKKGNLLPLILLLLAPIPAALTTEDAPNLHRALFMIPFISTITGLGIVYLIETRKKLVPIIYALVALNFIYYLHMYYVHNKVNLPLYRNVGAKDLAVYLKKVQGNYDKIVLTNIPDDPYPWIAYFTGRDPAKFNNDAILREKGVWTSENLIFTGQRCPSRDVFANTNVKRMLVIDAEGCSTESKLKNRPDIKLDFIRRPDGSEVYDIWSMTGE